MEGILGKIQSRFEDRVSGLEKWKKEIEGLLSGGVSTNVSDLPERVTKLETELRMIKARMAKKDGDKPTG